MDLQYEGVPAARSAFEPVQKLHAGGQHEAIVQLAFRLPLSRPTDHSRREAGEGRREAGEGRRETGDGTVGESHWRAAQSFCCGACSTYGTIFAMPALSACFWIEQM
jgi:hypothetical protein